ncbi:hypothetical protein EML15_03270 [Corynebacterium sp. sy017]|uniref:hypothetical protein n=1 Tax=unclassified Corynebacterium TaxID=2624378 RepID=UPI001185CDEC|nr:MULTISPECIES: hypothetical protein [unclassified Corynebacterium]MBP3088171.1 hypothetical protein [Corynebacterium sp. sy017]TSD92677.1 hypothetical protein ELY17_03270 [Corynebacterium sp. SY003]
MGDEKQVTWQVQLAKLVSSDDHIQTSRGAQIMIPSTVKDVSIKLTHMPDESPQETEDYDPVQEVDYQVPIVDSMEEVPDDETYYIASFVKNPYGSLSEVKDSVATYGVDPSTFENQPDWDFYQAGLLGNGIYTFEVTGTVKAVGADTYVPIRAENMLWKCGFEGVTPGSAEEECQNLKEKVEFRTGELPPVTTAEQSEETRNKIVELYKKQGKVDGLTGVGACAVTQNTDRFDTIGSDIEDAAEGKHHAYRNKFNLYLLPQVNFYGSLNGDEDNCDQGFQHITLCPDEETEVPSSEEPVESEEPTPSEDPEKVGPAKPSKESEEPTASEESGESEGPTSSKKSQEPGEPISSEESVSSESKFVPSAQSEQHKPADSKPAPKTVIAESVKDNVAKQAKTVAKKDRPKVTTGGHLRVA